MLNRDQPGRQVVSLECGFARGALHLAHASRLLGTAGSRCSLLDFISQRLVLPGEKFELLAGIAKVRSGADLP
jgi:hypothetical protein